MQGSSLDIIIRASIPFLENMFLTWVIALFVLLYWIEGKSRRSESPLRIGVASVPICIDEDGASSSFPFELPFFVTAIQTTNAGKTGISQGISCSAEKT